MTSTAPAAAGPVQLAAVEEDLHPGSVIRLAVGGPDLEIVATEKGATNVRFELTILTGAFAGSRITRYVHPYETIQHVQRPCPECGGPTIAADPRRPEEQGWYCERCGLPHDERGQRLL